MTQIPDSLKKLRDEKKYSHPRLSDIEDLEMKGLYRTAFKDGFDAACAELLPVIEEMRNKFISHLHTMESINEHLGYQFTQPLINARQSLAAADKILGKT